MLEYLFLALFIAAFFLLIRRDRVYGVPMVLIVYSNINGLLGWESFALKGVIKFQDYGLLLTLGMLFPRVLALRNTELEYISTVRKVPLYNAVNVFWVYYLCLFVFSVFIQNNLLWPIKMARVFFYGLVFYLIYRELLPDPLVKFEKIINCLMAATLIFGLLYIAYNIMGWELYPKGEHESFDLGYLVGEVKRNFSGFPMFAYYFIFLFTEKLMQGKGNKLFNVASLMILLFCVLLMLTRGAVILTGLMVGFMIVYRRPTVGMVKRLFILLLFLLIAAVLVPIFAEGHYLAMLQRFDEFSKSGLAGSSNFRVRSDEFLHIVKNVMDFDPFFGFGFTVVGAFGYTSNVLFGGSADNGFSNILGTTGFVGLGFFLLMISCWLVVNVKLQALRAEPYSRVNFVFIIFMLGSFMNGPSLSYMHTFALFLAYDLLVYGYLTHGRQPRSRFRGASKNMICT